MATRTKTPGSGRKAGTPNKLTADVRAAVLGALSAVGGQKYLEDVARKDPRTFCALLGRVLPLQVGGDPDSPIAVTLVKRIVIDPHGVED